MYSSHSFLGHLRISLNDECLGETKILIDYNASSEAVYKKHHSFVSLLVEICKGVFTCKIWIFVHLIPVNRYRQISNVLLLYFLLFRLDENNTVKNPNTCLRSNKESYSNQLEKSEANVENTIFVGNLPNSIELKELKKMFRKFGVVINARLRGAVRKELKIPKRLSVIKKEFHDDSEHINAYIKFSSIDSCKAALKMNGEMYQSRHLRVSLASDSGKADPRKSVFLGNLPFSKCHILLCSWTSNC